MVEEEEEELKKKRLEQEKRDKEELVKIMEDMDLTWEEKKRKEQELLSKKRVRMLESGEGQKQKRLKKVKYRLIGEEWGEDTDDKEIDALYDVEQGSVSSSPPGELRLQLPCSGSRGGRDPGSSRSVHVRPPLL